MSCYAAAADEEFYWPTVYTAVYDARLEVTTLNLSAVNVQ